MQTVGSSQGSSSSGGASCTGGICITTIASGLNGAAFIALDQANVYWTNASNAGTVMQAPFDGGPPITLASGQNGPLGIAVDSTYVYWANGPTGIITKTPVGGGSTTQVAVGLFSAAGIAVDSTNVYCTISQWAPAGGVMRVPISGSMPARALVALAPMMVARAVVKGYGRAVVPE